MGLVGFCAGPKVGLCGSFSIQEILWSHENDNNWYLNCLLHGTLLVFKHNEIGKWVKQRVCQACCLMHHVAWWENSSLKRRTNRKFFLKNLNFQGVKIPHLWHERMSDRFFFRHHTKKGWILFNHNRNILRTESNLKIWCPSWTIKCQMLIPDVI